jgi:hypothetical protein
VFFNCICDHADQVPNRSLREDLGRESKSEPFGLCVLTFHGRTAQILPPGLHQTQPLESINDVFQRLKTGKVNGRVALTIGVQASQEDSRSQHELLRWEWLAAEVLEGSHTVSGC